MQDSTDIHLYYTPLDPGAHAVLVRTGKATHIALDSNDPKAAMIGFEAIMRDQFISGAWQIGPSAN